MAQAKRERRQAHRASAIVHECTGMNLQRTVFVLDGSTELYDAQYRILSEGCTALQRPCCKRCCRQTHLRSVVVGEDTAVDECSAACIYHDGASIPLTMIVREDAVIDRYRAADGFDGSPVLQTGGHRGLRAQRAPNCVWLLGALGNRAVCAVLLLCWGREAPQQCCHSSK